MNDRYFLDTNTIVYSFDNTDVSKRQVSQRLIQHALGTRQGHISYQVVQEFLNVAIRKFSTPLTHRDSCAFLQDILSPLCSIYPSITLYEKALYIHDRWKFSFFDSLIVASALAANCTVLFSEDLQHDQTIETLKIQNPFIEQNSIHEQLGVYQVVPLSS